MDRDHLLQLLAGDSAVLSLARTAVEGGAPFDIWPKEVPTQQLRSIYTRRMRTAERAGQPSIGFAEVLESLGSYRGNVTKIGFIDDRNDGGYYFQLFVDPGEAGIIGCLAIRLSEGDDYGRSDRRDPGVEG